MTEVGTFLGSTCVGAEADNPRISPLATPPTPSFNLTRRHTKLLESRQIPIAVIMMASASSETEVYTTPPTSPSQLEARKLPGHLLGQSSFLDLNFDENQFSLPNKARGICCLAKNVWYSNRYWPEIWNAVWKKLLATMPWTVELRLAGARQVGKQEVTMRSTVWIRSTDEAIWSNTVWKKLQKEVRRLGLDSVHYATIFAEGGLRLANDTTSVPLERLPLSGGVQFSDRVTLYTHVALWSTDGSYGCGQVCLAIIIAGDKIVYQQTARIGGVLSVNSVYMAGVTSGHSMLLYFLQNSEQLSFIWQDYSNVPTGSGIPAVTFKSLHLPEALQVLELDSDSDHDDKDSVSECELVENNHSDPGIIDDLGYLDLELVKTWVPLRPSDTINFISQAEINLSSVPPLGKLKNPSTCPIPADFALLTVTEPDFNLTPDNNVYYSDEPKHVSGICTDTWLSSSEHDILVLLGNGRKPSPGFLLPAKIPFYIGNTIVWTRKIRLTAPLGRGTSGSWVVSHHSGLLCGSIVAVFEHEPYALMVTAQALFSDIIQYSQNIVLVTLGAYEPVSVSEQHPFVLNDLHRKVGMSSIDKKKILHLAEAIQTAREAAASELDEDADPAGRFYNIGVNVVTRYERTAEKYAATTMGSTRGVIGKESPSALVSMVKQALTYSKQGRWKEAERLELQVVETCKTILGEDHPETLRGMTNLAMTYSSQGRLDKAEAMYNRALQGYEKALGSGHISTLSTVNNLGLLYADQGRLDKAEAMYERALQGYEKAVGPEHTSILDTVNNLGVLYKNQGRLDKAEAMYERALQGYEKALGSGHTSTLSTVNNLGLLYADQGRLDKAEAMYNRALQGYEKSLGPEQTPTLDVVTNLGNLYKSRGRLDKAEAMYNRALQGYEEALGAITFKTYVPALITFANVGLLHQERSEPGLARQYYLRAQVGLRTVFGDDSNWVKTVSERLKEVSGKHISP
ncbi:NB-ARC TPR domain-containing protein [Fusarium circinatum]|uniref:NB-ARC TPR domain-containing protein n=1 Tax=Fusarium circinatum TaxID=48490 RepID=A0A8H5TKL1_FUSCI|nr:NB-ARC TPR domain-containing protein [Fusarium circinatum]